MINSNANPIANNQSMQNHNVGTQTVGTNAIGQSPIRNQGNSNQPSTNQAVNQATTQATSPTTSNGPDYNTLGLNSETNQTSPIQTVNPQEQMNITDFYGLDSAVGCSGSGCRPNDFVDTGYTIPSITDIVKLNQATITNAQNIDRYSGNLTQIPAVNALEEEDALLTPLPQDTLDTPSTVLNYGPTMDNQIINNSGLPVTDYAHPYPVTQESIQYLNGFIRTQIGRRVSIDFLVGSNSLVTKQGYLLGVASNYILINEIDTNDLTTCDFYNIKFIRFFY